MAKVNKGRSTGVHRPKPSTAPNKAVSKPTPSPKKQANVSSRPNDRYEAGRAPPKTPEPTALSLQSASAPSPASQEGAIPAIPAIPEAEISNAQVLTTTAKTPPLLKDQTLHLEADYITRLSEELRNEVAQPGEDFQVINSGAHPIILTPSFALKFVGDTFQADELEATNIYLALGEAAPQWQTASLKGASTKTALGNLKLCAEREKTTYDAIVTEMKPLEAEQKKKQKNVMTNLQRLGEISDELKKLDPFGEGNTYWVKKSISKCNTLLEFIKDGQSFLLGTRVKGENLGALLSKEKYTATLFEDDAKNLNSILFQMGRVAVKDLLTGNPDRLCEFKKNPTDDSIELKVGVNEGNLMLDPNDGISKARMVCIDNGVFLGLTNEQFQSGIDSHFGALPDALWACLKKDHFTPKVLSSTQVYQAYQTSHPDCDDDFRAWIQAGLNAGLKDLSACDEAQLPDDSPRLKDRLAILKKVTP